MEFVTQNGVEVNIVTAPTKAVMRLKREVIKHLKNKGFMDQLGKNSLFDLNISSVLDLFIDIDTSEDFEKAVFDCLKVCIYDTQGKKIRISEQMFDDMPEAREDYYEILTKCCEVNLRPFFKSLFLELNARLKTISDEDQEQK